MYYYEQNPAGRRALLADRSRFLMLNKNQIHRPELKLIHQKILVQPTRQESEISLGYQININHAPILPKNERGGAELFHILSKQPKTRVEWQRNHTDIDADRPEIALCVYLESTFTMVVSEVF